MQTTVHRTTSRFSLHRRVCFTDKQLRPQKPSSDRPAARRIIPELRERVFGQNCVYLSRRQPRLPQRTEWPSDRFANETWREDYDGE